ncbi:MAG: DMT family transporter [Candidatus Thermoplasmatota archaeon]|nr:DMT family transporter [Candidatus Thermoplasmatota archaeon]
MGLGSVLKGAAYGLSLVLYMLSLRKVGSARTGTLFAVSPFVGVVLSIAIFMDTPSLQFVISLPLMVVGLALLFRESHRHIHEHEELDHDHHHDHSDGHHGHEHGTEMGSHYHPHHHGRTIHSHSHMPDIHHRHKHRR